MFDVCVLMSCCGIYVLGWFSDGYFVVVDGVVFCKVCFYWSGNCCRWFRNVCVCNCGNFYVYELLLIEYCFLWYCGNRE